MNLIKSILPKSKINGRYLTLEGNPAAAFYKSIRQTHDVGYGNEGGTLRLRLTPLMVRKGENIY